ncbi:MAG: hypothetical protein E7368_01985 [Clostridiales bacterium]|nr:hypothetical protein [Clostridiales bacterium]
MAEENKEQTKITEIGSVLELVRGISEREKFLEFCNTRDFEDAMYESIKNIHLTEALRKDIEEYIENHYEEDKNLCFALFFMTYTICRKMKNLNLVEYTEKHVDKFGGYKFFEFIELLAYYNTYFDNRSRKKIIRKVKELSESKGVNNVGNAVQTWDYTKHGGVINFYVESICSYYEECLQERDDNREILEEAKKKIEGVIGKGENYDKYSKYHLTLGRVYALLGDYDLAETKIHEAITYIDKGEQQERTIKEYEQYLLKMGMIKLYDANDKKIKEVEKIKMDNIKTLSLITGFLGFLLGGINIFTEVKETKAMAFLMLTYVGIIGVLLGVMLVGVKLLYKEKNKKFTAYTIGILIAGLAVVGLSFWLLFR